jgi:hypothetical protein
MFGAIGRGIYWAIGAIQAAGELLSAGSRLVKRMRKGVVPHVDDTQPIPLTHKDAERIAEFGRRAAHENEPRK